MRIDFKVQQKVYQTLGLKELMAYQKLPLVVVDYLKEAIPSDSHSLKMWFPFANAVYRIPDAFGNVVYAQIRVLDVNAAFDYLGEISGLNSGWCSEGICIGTLLAEESGNEVGLLDTNINMHCYISLKLNVYTFGHDTNRSPRRLSKEYERVIASNLMLLGNFLNETEKKLVEVRQSTQSQSSFRKHKAKKTALKKPHLRDDLPTIILIDPRNTSAHGRSVPQGGTHASPKPHQRRGHMRLYKHPKFRKVLGKILPVSSTWVGDKEWVFNGNEYKVLDETRIREHVNES